MQITDPHAVVEIKHCLILINTAASITGKFVLGIFAALYFQLYVSIQTYTYVHT